MTESSTYQAIFRKGEAVGIARGEAMVRAAMARHFLVVAGKRRLGVHTSEIQARIDVTDSIDLLDKMIENVLSVESWDDLLTAE